MDPFRACLAILPLAVYLLVIGFINLSRRPFMTTGGRDRYALGLALAGLFAVGPMELFMPLGAAGLFGGYVWLLLFAFYFLLVTFLVLIARPRIVVYNITVEELRPIVARLVNELDGEHRWAGNSVMLPKLGIQLQIERFAATRNVALAANATDQSFAGWRQLERRLAAALAETETAANPLGVFFVSTSSLLFAAAAFLLARFPEAALRGLQSWLQV
ncbi:MAG: hypothetical protein WD030_10140 [Pirellulales bacterium]